jgi:hypothetical protein
MWGMGFTIGPVMGVDFGGRKGGSFFKKCGKFKKLLKFSPRVPKPKKIKFLLF